MLPLKNQQAQSHIVYIGHNPHAWERYENVFVGSSQCMSLNMNINHSCLKVASTYISNISVVLFIVEISHGKGAPSLCFQQLHMEWRRFWTYKSLHYSESSGVRPPNCIYYAFIRSCNSSCNFLPLNC